MASSSQKQKQLAAKKKLKERIQQQLKRGAGKGVEAAARFLTARVKETVSVPAPKKAIRGTPTPGKKLGPILGYRATTPAIPGAPPRVLSGRLRQGVGHKMLGTHRAVVGVHARAVPTAKHPDGFNYPKHHEVGQGGSLGDGDHPFILPTVRKWRKALQILVGQTVRMELKQKQ